MRRDGHSLEGNNLESTPGMSHARVTDILSTEYFDCDHTQNFHRNRSALFELSLRLIGCMVLSRVYHMVKS